MSLVNLFPKNSAVFGSWETISKVISNSISIVNVGRYDRNGWWRMLSLKDDTLFPETIGDNLYRPDLYTANAVFEYLNKGYRPQFLWISLGDTDEFAHMGDYKNYLESLKKADKFIGELIAKYDSNTTFIITTDHGRGMGWRDHGSDKESARTWFMMYGNKIPARGFTDYTYTVHSADIYDTVAHIAFDKKSDRSLLK